MVMGSMEKDEPTILAIPVRSIWIHGGPGMADGYCYYNILVTALPNDDATCWEILR